jgi:hypothetical protein
VRALHTLLGLRSSLGIPLQVVAFPLTTLLLFGLLVWMHLPRPGPRRWAMGLPVPR